MIHKVGKIGPYSSLKIDKQLVDKLIELSDYHINTLKRFREEVTSKGSDEVYPAQYLDVSTLLIYVGDILLYAKEHQNQNGKKELILFNIEVLNDA